MTDLLAIAFLVVMEGLLSFDNALALAAMVAPLPESQRRKALTYGMVGAFGFRFLALAFVTFLMEAVWVKYLGGAYLLWLSASFFFANKGPGLECYSSSVSRNFWKTVLMIEIADIAFSMDSILAAVAVSSKLWVVVTGGVLGIVLMRFAASWFVTLMASFPKLERSAFILVAIVGSKMICEALCVNLNLPISFDSADSLVFWLFWASMAIGLGGGFTERTVESTYAASLRSNGEG